MDKNTMIKIQITDEYERIRTRNAQRQEIIRQKIYAEIPKLRGIEAELSEILKKMIGLTLTHGEDFSKLDELKMRVDFLLKQKEELLHAHHYSSDIFQDIYECSECKDTGVIGDKFCKCYQKKLIDKLFENSELHEKLKYENFDHFDYEIFSNQIPPQDKSDFATSDISPRQNIEEIRSFAEEFIENFKRREFKNLYFYGKSGLGKTYMSSCIAREILYQGHDVVYKTFYEIMDIVRLYKFDYNDKEAREKYELLLKTDLLIIDDLDSGNLTSFNTSEFFNILNTRILNYKKMIISTNIDAKNLQEALGERIASRIYGNFILLKFIGDDLRI